MRVLDIKKVETHETEISQVATYANGVPLRWKEVETGVLPANRIGARAAVVDNIIYVIGGETDCSNSFLSSILYWNATSETWGSAGSLSLARYRFGAVAINSSVISNEC